MLGILKHIDKKVFEAYLVCPSGYLSAEAKQVSGVEVINFSSRSKFDIFAIFKLRHILNLVRSSRDPFGPMIIHSHGPRAILFAGYAKPIGVKSVYTEHRWDESYHLRNPINDWLQRAILRKQNLKTNLIIAVSSSVKKFLSETDIVHKEKIKVIPNAVEITGHPLRSSGYAGQAKGGSRGAADPKAPIIGTIGNLNYQKGHSYLIEAMEEIVKHFPLATLEIIGEGEERPILEDKIKKLGLTHHVTLSGQKFSPKQYLKHWSAFVLPSVAETFGIVVLEAMEAGIPVIATKVGGIPDIITSGKNGILVESKNAKELADSVIKTLSNLPLLASLKREGLKRVKDFSWDKVIKQIETSYIELFK